MEGLKDSNLVENLLDGELPAVEVYLGINSLIQIAAAGLAVGLVLIYFKKR